MPQSKTVLVGFFDIEHYGPDSVEVPCTGRGEVDYQALRRAIRLRHPAATIKRTGSTFEVRDGSENSGYIDLTPGLTLRQLFDSDSANEDPRTSRRVGSVFFDGTPCNIMLTFNRAAGRIGVVLMPRVNIGTCAIQFQTDLSPLCPAEDLEHLMHEVLGGSVKALRLLVRKPAPALRPAPPEAPKPAPVLPETPAAPVAPTVTPGPSKAHPKAKQKKI